LQCRWPAEKNTGPVSSRRWPKIVSRKWCDGVDSRSL
jgi:hypothetical protein